MINGSILVEEAILGPSSPESRRCEVVFGRIVGGEVAVRHLVAVDWNLVVFCLTDERQCLLDLKCRPLVVPILTICI
jgi:hypothetical protein